MQRKQSGLTLIGFLIVLAVGGFFAYLGMRVVPMYMEYYSVKQALKGMAEEPGIGNQDPGRLRELFSRRMNMSYASNVKPEHLKIERSDAGYRATVDYEVRKPFVHNLDVIGRFHAEQELARGTAP